MEYKSIFNSDSLLCKKRRFFHQDEHCIDDLVDRQSEIEKMTFSDIYWDWYDNTEYHNIFCESFDKTRGLCTTRDLFFFSSIKPNEFNIKRKTSMLDNPLISSRNGNYVDGKIYVHDGEYYDEYSERMYRSNLLDHLKNFIFIKGRN